VGISGEGNGISFSQKESLDQFSTGSSSQAPQNNIPGGSPINKELSMLLGFSAKKEINKQLSFLTGINFHYYSSERKVGTQMQDSTMPSIGFVSRYFLNYGPSVTTIKSRYHFLSIPLMFDWKFIPDKAFHLQAGVSLQQLISADAIQFNSQNGIYYKDPSLLKKTQLFAHTMLGYEFNMKNKASMQIGPSLQYGLSRLNENENKHLFYAGLNIQYFFK
jgi:hypothetical protein